MPPAHARYPLEYRRRIIELARSRRKIEERAREFEPSANAIRKWVKQAALDEGLRSDGAQHFGRPATVTPAMMIQSGRYATQRRG